MAEFGARGALSRKLRVSRTLVPQLQAAHDRLLDRYPLYNAWHLQPFALVTHAAMVGGLLAFGTAVLFQSVAVVRAANACVSATSGLWSAPATWTSCGGTIPGPTDTVTIASGHKVTVDVDSAAASLVINANAVAGNDNGLTINSGKTLAITGAIAMSAPSAAATSTIGIGAGSLIAGSIAIPGSATAGRFATVSLSTGTLTTSGSVTFSGTAAQARFISTGASVANIGGDFGSGGTLTTSGTGSIRFTGSVAQGIGAYTTYNNVEVASTGGAVSFLGTTTIGGTLQVTTGTLDMGAVSPTVSGATTVSSTLQVSSTTGTKTLGDITIASGGTMSFTAAEAITETGNLVVSGTGAITGTTGVWTFQRVGGGTISGSASAVSIASATFTTDYAVSIPFVSPKITVTGVNLTNNTTTTANTTLAGTGTLIQGANATLNLGGTITITGLTATASPNTVNYTSTTAAQTIKNTTYHHLVVTKSGQIGTLAGATTVNGDLTVSAGSLNDGGFQITGNGTGILTVANGATLRLGTTTATTIFPTGYVAANISLPTGSTVVYNSNLAQTIDVPVAYANLSLVATAASTKTLAGPLTVNGTLNVGANNTLADAGNLITAKGDIVMTGVHTGTNEVKLTGSSGGHTLTGGGRYAKLELSDSNGAVQTAVLTVTGSLLLTTGTWTSTNTLTVNGSTTVGSTLTIASTTGTKTFADITVQGGGTLKFTAAETLAGNGNLTVASGGTVDFTAAGILNLAGDVTMNGTAALTGTSGLWTLSKVGGGALGGTASALTIPGSVTFATSYTIGYPLTVSGMTVNAGATETNPSTITVNGTLGGGGSFVQGPGTVLNLRSGTITTLAASAAGNTVHYIDGGGTIKGTTYNDLDIAETTGSTATASGTVVVNGNLTNTSGTLNPASSTFTVVGSTDIYDTIRDSSGGGSGGLNTFQGPVNVHAGANWTGISGEAVDYHFQNGLILNSATFVAGSGSYIFETNNQSLTGSSVVDFRSMQVNGITLTPSVSFDVSSVLAMGVGSTLNPDPTVVVNGTTTQGTLNGTGVVNVTRTAATADFASQYKFTTYTLATIDVFYVGTAAQVLSPVAYSDVTIDNTSGVTLNSDVTIGGVLAMTNGLATTGANRLIIGSGGALVRGTGYVVGRLQKPVPTGSPAFSFEIGDATQYTPIDIAFASVTTGGDLLATVTPGDHPDIANAGVAFNKSANRYWSFDEIGLNFTSYDATFHFVSTDLDPNANTTTFVVAKKDTGWTTLTPGTRTATSTQATGVTSFSDYVVGKLGPDMAPVASTVTISGGNTIGSTLTGSYAYSDTESDAEGMSTFRWLRNGSPISGANTASYVVATADVGTTLTFEVTPAALTGTTPGVAATSAGFAIPSPTSTTTSGSNETTDTTTTGTGGTTTGGSGGRGGTKQPANSGQSPAPEPTIGNLPTIVPELPQFMADVAKSTAERPLLVLVLLSLLCLVLYRWPWILAWLDDQLYVGGLDRSLDEAEVRKIFGAIGKVDAVRMHDKPSHHGLRYAFVKMRADSSARKAIKELHGATVEGHALVVKRIRTFWQRKQRDAAKK